MTNLCPLEHAEDAEASPYRVCRWHVRQCLRALREIPSLHRALEHRLSPTGSELTGMPHGSKDPGLVLDHRVVEVRADMVNATATWARSIADDRKVGLPPDLLPAVCLFLTAHSDWTLMQPFGPAFTLDMLGPWETGMSLLQPNEARRFAVGPCPEDGCTGTLIARLRPHDSLLPHEVTCDQSPIEDGNALHAWTADRWLTLGRKIRRTEG